MQPTFIYLAKQVLIWDIQKNKKPTDWELKISPHCYSEYQRTLNEYYNAILRYRLACQRAGQFPYRSSKLADFEIVRHCELYYNCHRLKHNNI